jgi:hypothetical protein
VAKYDHLVQNVLGEVVLSYNPNVETSTLKVSSILNTKTGEEKVDFRVWTSKPEYEGPTPGGFRITKEQYIELRKIIPSIDKSFGIKSPITETGSEATVGV